jgi:hypothetical protein
MLFCQYLIQATVSVVSVKMNILEGKGRGKLRVGGEGGSGVGGELLFISRAACTLVSHKYIFLHVSGKKDRYLCQAFYRYLTCCAAMLPSSESISH